MLVSVSALSRVLSPLVSFCLPLFPLVSHCTVEKADKPLRRCTRAHKTLEKADTPSIMRGYKGRQGGKTRGEKGDKERQDLGEGGHTIHMKGKADTPSI